MPSPVQIVRQKQSQELVIDCVKLRRGIVKHNTSWYPKDQHAVHLLASTAVAHGHDVQDMTLSSSSVHRARAENRKAVAADINSMIQIQPSIQGPLTIHWDGKLLPGITICDKVDILQVIVIGIDNESLLGLPRLLNETGKAQAGPVFTCMDDYNISDQVRRLCFGTTSSITEHFNGACILIQGAIGIESSAHCLSA